MGHISSTYDTSIIPRALKVLLFHHCLLMLSPSPKPRYSVRESAIDYALGLIVFVLFGSFCSFRKSATSSSGKILFQVH